MMRWRLSPMLIGLVLVGYAFGQEPGYRMAPAPDWVVEQVVQADVAVDQECVEGGEEVLLLDRQYHLGSEGLYWRKVTRLSTSEAVQNGSRFEISFDPSFQRMVIHHVRIIRNGQVIEKFDRRSARVLRREADMSSFLYDGAYTVVLELTDVRVGDIVDQAVSFFGWNPVDQGRFHRRLGMGFSIPMARNHLRMVMPPGREPRLATHGGAEQPRVERLGANKVWIWDGSPTPCLQVDAGVPPWFEPYPWIEISEFKDVEELRRWALEQYAHKGTVSGALEARIAGIRELPDPDDRLDSAVNLVQREVRYLGLEDGISAYRPHLPGKVYDQKFGDCKDKSLLLTTILRSVGIPAYPALVNTVNGHALGGYLPRPSLFDHCITVIPNEGDTLWVDATSTYNGGVGSLRYTPYFGKALVVSEDAKGLATMIVRDQGSVDVTETIVLDSLGGEGQLTILSEFRGGRADAMRSTLATRSMAELGKNFTDYYSGIYGSCEALGLFEIKDDRLANVLRVEERYRMLQPWDTIDDGANWRFGISASYVKDYQAVPGEAARTTPFQLGEPVEVRHLFHVTLPERWNVTDAYTTRSGHGITFERDIRMGRDGVVTIDHRYASTLRYVEEADAKPLHDLQSSISDELYFEFTHPTGAVATDQSVPRSTWLFLVFSCVVAAFLAWRIHGFDPEPDAIALGKPGRAIGGFLILPAIGICLSIVRVVIEMFQDDGWFFFMTSSPLGQGSGKELLGTLYVHLSQLNGIVMLGFLVILALLFFQRRSSVPVLMMAFYGWNLAWVVIDMTLYSMVDGEGLTGEPYEKSEFGRAFLAAAIWIPVFHLSERVKTTFTEQLDPLALAVVNAVPKAQDSEGVHPAH